ncbi:hypothetical protein HA466_0314450 [Hirschfeldia incana]|nr:hypothetical protein HA466_0314450 [Hirschfeldia incana]
MALATPLKADLTRSYRTCSASRLQPRSSTKPKSELPCRRDEDDKSPVAERRQGRASEGISDEARENRR